MELAKGLEHQSYEEQLQVFALEERRLRGNFLTLHNSWQEGAALWASGSAPRGQGTTQDRENGQGGSGWILGKVYSVQEWSGIGRGYPGQYWSACPWMCSKNEWTLGVAQLLMRFSGRGGIRGGWIWWFWRVFNLNNSRFFLHADVGGAQQLSLLSPGTSGCSRQVLSHLAGHWDLQQTRENHPEQLKPPQKSSLAVMCSYLGAGNTYLWCIIYSQSAEYRPALKCKWAASSTARACKGWTHPNSPFLVPKAKLTQLQSFPSGSFPGENNLCFSFALLNLRFPPGSLWCSVFIRKQIHVLWAIPAVLQLLPGVSVWNTKRN